MLKVRLILFFILASLLAGCDTLSSKSISGKPKAKTLTADQVTALFSNRTVESYNPRRKTTSFTYYALDGSLLQERFWEMRYGSWKVTADGQICLTFKKTTCRFIASNLDKYYKYRVEDNNKKKTTVYYKRFIAGNVLE